MFNKDNILNPKADIKDGALVLYLPTAFKPCVWRMDLKTLSETSIEIDEKDGAYILATRDINGVTKAIAGFNNKGDAQQALSLTLKALMQKNNANQSNASFLNGFPMGGILKWGILALIILWFGAWLITPSKEQPAPNEVTKASTPTQNTSIDETGQVKIGVPVDVDSLFKQPEQQE